ncbi:hypothetical protein Tco_0812345 [Tanacetum coccineum]
MERGEGEADINSVLNTFNSKISNIMNNDVNHDKKFEATSEVSPCEFDKEQVGWEDTNILAKNESFVNVVTAELPKKKVNFRTLTNDEQVAYSDFVLPLATIDEAKHRFANSLVGYFIGK